MPRLAAAVLFLLACGSDGEDVPDAPSNQNLSRCPPSTAQGVACQGTGRCYTSGAGPCGFEWGPTALAVCECRNGQFDCTLPLADGTYCAFPDGTGCGIEGYAACDDPQPRSGNCACQHNVWTCTYWCPPECNTIMQVEGSSCTLPAGVTCLYHSGTWSCVDGGAHCTSGFCPPPDGGID